MTEPGDVTRVLAALTAGDSVAAEELFPLVYDELRRLAGECFHDEPADHTLQPTALVHEAYLRLVGAHNGDLQNRGHFFWVAAQAMRRILIDHARRRRSMKRGGGRSRHSLDEALATPGDRDCDVESLLALDDALTKLGSLDTQLARVVELRYFGGLTSDEIAKILDVSLITVKRRWKIAKGWLHREMTRGG